MDTNWNSTDKDPGKALEAFVAEEVREAMGTGGAAKLLRPGGRVKALAGFLAFFLGMTLVLSSLCAAGDRIVWERGPSPRWEWDWQETDAFRGEVSHYLREFLTIGAGGEVDFYDQAYWTEYGGEATVVQEAEAYRSWWGSYPLTEAVVVEGGLAECETQSDSFHSTPAESKKVREPDEAYRNDKNLLYYIETAEGKTYTNAEGRLAFFLEAKRLRHASSVDFSKVPQEQKDYNVFLTFQNGKVSIVKDGADLDVYGNGLYNNESQWFVPGYDNFPVSKDLEHVTVYMAVRRTPERYYGVDYKNGGTYSNNAFYGLARQVEESESFYKTQGLLLLIALWCLAVWALLRKSVEPLNRKIASWTVHVWTEVRALLVLICLLWAFLPGLANTDLFWSFKYGLGWALENGLMWGSGYFDSATQWFASLGRLLLTNVSGFVTLFWLCWLLYNDHRRGLPESRKSLLGALFRSLRARDLKRPIEKRLSRNSAAGLLALGLLLLAEAVNWLCFFLYMFGGMFSGGQFIQINGVMLFIQLPLGLLALPLAVLFHRVWRSRGLARDIAALADQVEAVRAGDLERPLVLPEDADLRQTAESLNDIQAGMRAALEEQTRSERMKVELVSNVSHDLKTPLTSILSYAELLRQEELPPAAADYAKIIDQKAQRLKTMVEDVFEVSKAAADQLPVHLERLDLAKLIRQTLADMDGAIQKSALTFRVDLPDRPVMITADGKRLYRVFQNLIDNALRYALEGSRVYLSLKAAEGTAEARVRNTSRSELSEGVDFTARFVRGDASRTDGGSGLGLSIASSFTEACGGAFRVETVADLFTAVVTFPMEQEGQEP